jgi:alpha-ketoglutarate-dependent taurine dioxygenase
MTIAAYTDDAVLPQFDAVRADFIEPVHSYPLVLTLKNGGLDIYQWIEEERETLARLLEKYGAILFRGFGLEEVQDFNKFVAGFGSPLLDYKERSSPRHEVSSRIYSSTDHPADQVINMHNENSYSRSWPLKLFFYCHTPADRGGETPIADSKKMLKLLRPSTLEKFRQKGVLYVRNLGGVLGLHWKEVFQTDNRQVVADYCHAKGIGFAWTDPDRLELKYFGPAIRKHPLTGEESWFNHAFFFNILSLDPAFVEEILSVMSKEEFSFLSYYGDGEEIESEVIEEIRAAYEKLKVFFSWRKGDVLLLDNMLVAHGRTAYEGPRRIMVAMCDPQYHE